MKEVEYEEVMPPPPTTVNFTATNPAYEQVVACNTSNHHVSAANIDNNPAYGQVIASNDGLPVIVSNPAYGHIS